MEICDFLKSWKRMCNVILEMDGCVDCPITSARCGDMPCEMQDIESIVREVEKWAAEHPEPVYPTWGEWMLSIGAARRMPTGIPYQLANGEIIEPPYETFVDLHDTIPADIAEKLGIEPKED